MTAPPLAAAPATADDWRRLWSFCTQPTAPTRRPTRTVVVGGVAIGSEWPIRVQSMTVADTLDTRGVVDEIERLHAAGCEIVRVTAPSRSAAENLRQIRAALARRGVRVPLVADIHFTPQAALIAAEFADKVRINPGNYADRKHFAQREYTDAEYALELERLEEAFRPLVLRCKERGVAMRIGTNHGSLSDRILNRYGDTPAGMVESALEFVRICEHHGYRDLVLSMKASDVKVMMQAYRLLALRMREQAMDYPFHLGVTEAGAGFAARIKSAIGIGALLADGLGDTVRVSLAEDSVRELALAEALARRSAPRTRRTPEPIAAAPAVDPFCFVRRAVRPAGALPARLATDTPPRIEAVRTLPRDPAQAPREAVRGLRAAAAGCDLVLLAADPVSDPAAFAPWVEAAGAGGNEPPVVGCEIPVAWLAHPAIRSPVAGLARLALRGTPAEFEAVAAAPPGGVPIQYSIETAGEADEVAAATLALAARWPAGVLAFVPPRAAAAIATAAARAALAVPAVAGWPLVLRARLDAIPARIDGDLAADELACAIALGGLLADGCGDAVQFEAPPERAVRLGAEILQATRLRLSKADFIACPSCGRTQFDLQATTARIEKRLRHLRGLKIAVMGCIVNGPGEMADADFGYVGSGPGRIDLYVGRERVVRGVLQDEAVDRLVALIRERGQWVDPPEPRRLES